MRKATKRLLWGLAMLFAFVLIWQKTRIVVVIRASFAQLLLLFVALAVVIYIVFDILLPD